MKMHLYQILKKLDKLLPLQAEYKGLQRPDSHGVDVTGTISHELLGLFGWQIRIPNVELNRDNEKIKDANLSCIKEDLVYAIAKNGFSIEEEPIPEEWGIIATKFIQYKDVQTGIKHNEVDLKTYSYFITSITYYNKFEINQDVFPDEEIDELETKNGFHALCRINRSDYEELFKVEKRPVTSIYWNVYIPDYSFEEIDQQQNKQWINADDDTISRLLFSKMKQMSKIIYGTLNDANYNDYMARYMTIVHKTDGKQAYPLKKPMLFMHGRELRYD
jgi:hypothetical protein